ncbi:MAG: helix-turn-helix transcriptional regulator [Candidatus Nanopelagicales bacterium]
MPDTGNRVRALRTARNLTQAELSESLGVSRQTINAIETGKFDPSLPLALKLSAFFALPTDALFWLTDLSPDPPPPD